MNKCDRDLLISPSIYTLFIFLLINPDWDRADYVLTDRVPPAIVGNLKRAGLQVKYVGSGDFLGAGPLAGIFRILLRNIAYLGFCAGFNQEHRYRHIFGNDEVIQSILYRKQGMILIEDGSFNLQPKEFFRERSRRIHRFLVTRIFHAGHLKNYVPYGFSREVKKIYLTHAGPVHEEIKDKITVVDLKQLWDSKSTGEKIAIQSVFGLKNETVISLDRYKNVLLTQPLCKNEGGFLSEKEKIAIYSELISGTPENELLIKTHPLEKTNYRKYFKNALIIDQPVPFQFFELFEYHPAKVITISSTAALKYKSKDCEVIFAGTEIDPRLVKMYGIVRL